MTRPNPAYGLPFAAPIFYQEGEEIPMLSCRSQRVNLVYDIDAGLDGLTWTADADLFQTQCRFDDTIVTRIINLTPVVTDAVGAHCLVPEDFDPLSGAMTWWAAQAWTTWLNHIGFAGGTSWRLCSAAGCTGRSPRSGRHVNCSEIGRLYHGGGNSQQGFRITRSRRLKRTFTNLQDELYWTASEYRANPQGAWQFCCRTGTQYFAPKQRKRLAWAVHPGLIADTRRSSSGLRGGLAELLDLQELATAHVWPAFRQANG
jgi:hypothetical protein